MRSLSIQHAARLWEAQLVPRERRMIEAYAAGVNAYVKQVGMLQFEFLLSGSRFEPWTVLDTLAMAKLMLFQLSMSWQLKAFRSGVAELYGVDLMKEIYPVTPEYQFISNIITVISDEDLKLNGLHIPKGFDTTLGTKNLQRRAPEGPKRLSKNFTSETGMTPDFTEGLAGMSNSWAIHGNYTKSGKPLLGNDPHLAHKIPGIWYLLTLKFPNGVTATGFSISGVPGVLIGRNNYVAWGYTASALENIDMYWLDIDEKHQTYYYNKTWVPLKLRRETIKVKGGADVTVDLYATHHGPVILRTPVASASIFLYALPTANLLSRFGTSAFMANPYALSWNGFGPHDRSVTAVYDMMMARNTREFLAAVDKHDTIPAAIIFATVTPDVTQVLGGRRHRTQDVEQDSVAQTLRRCDIRPKRQSS